MQTYVLRVHRTHPSDAGSISGVLENIDSGQNHNFHSFTELQSLLAYSISKGQLGFPDFVPQELDTHENVAVIG